MGKEGQSENAEDPSMAAQAWKARSREPEAGDFSSGSACPAWTKQQDPVSGKMGRERGKESERDCTNKQAS